MLRFIGWRPALVGVGVALFATPAAAGRAWTFQDIVEVTRIASTASTPDGARAAFVTRQMSLADNATRYALSEVGVDATAGPRRLAEGRFLDQVQWNRAWRGWTVLADLGRGVQLYAVDEGGLRLLLERPPVPLGGPEGLLTSASEPERPTGVLRYGWSASGEALWYVQVLPPSAQTLAAWRTQGLRYAPGVTSSTAFRGGPPMEAIELRVWNPATGEDQLAARADGASPQGSSAFGEGEVAWLDDDRLVFVWPPAVGGERPEGGRWMFDRRTGASGPDPAAPKGPSSASQGSSLGGSGLVEGRGAAAPATSVRRSHATRLGGPFGAWRSEDGARTAQGALYWDRLGLSTTPRAAWDDVAGSLTACSFNASLTQAVCSHEDQVTAPRLVRISADRTVMRVIAEPNRRYRTLPPLQVRRLAPRQDRPAGYLILPRDYQTGRRYPTVVVTHASDARDQFAFLGLQWGFPVQVLAEHGYAVALVNERAGDAAALAAYRGQTSRLPSARVRQAMAGQSVEILEGAVANLVADGICDPSRVALAGYSRGGIVTGLALSRSRVFKTGIIADTALFSAGGYWRSEDLRRAYQAVFGGSPADPAHQAAYRAFAPSWRADRFAGPVLQLMTAKVAPHSLELDTELRQAGVPTELIVYPDETHLPHRPQTLRAAMQVSFDWIEYWLQGRCRPGAARDCARWARSSGSTFADRHRD